jgi:uncharacterized protein
MKPIGFESGTWWNEPPTATISDGSLTITTADKSDLWRHTSYGFIHDTGHGLLAPFPDNSAMECDVEATFSEDFDQAGLLVFASATQWIKCGIEFADGVAHLGAVVTNDVSDWSAGPAPLWGSGTTRFRVSRSGDALTIRAQRPGGPWQLVRLAPLNPDLTWSAGPYAASPSRANLEVTFRSWKHGKADTSLH